MKKFNFVFLVIVFLVINFIYIRNFYANMAFTNHENLNRVFSDPYTDPIFWNVNAAEVFFQNDFTKELAEESDAFTLFKIKVPQEQDSRPFIFQAEILYYANIVDAEEVFVASGLYEFSEAFICYQDDVSYSPQISKNLCKHSDGTTDAEKVIRFIEPTYDADTKEISIKIQNAAGLDEISNTNFDPLGTIKKHYVHVKILSNMLFEIPINISEGNFQINYDLTPTPSNKLIIHSNCEIEGNGHTISFLRNTPKTIEIEAGVTVIFKNIIFENFTEDSIYCADGANVIFGDGTYIKLAQDGQLTRPFTFYDNVIVNGQGNSIDLSDEEISIAQFGTLCLQNVTLHGINGTNLHCLGNLASIILKSSNLNLSGEYTFSNGSLRFQQNVTLRGPFKFKYQTSKTLYIEENSSLIFDLESQFSYEPSVANRDLLTMQDATSRLYLNGCTLSTTITGMRLTKGTLVVDHKNFLYNDGAVCKTHEGFEFGNGVESDDLTIYIKPGAMIYLKSGILNYNNS